MLSPSLLQILRCPDTRQTLAVADGSVVAQVNEAIAAGRVRDRGGRSVNGKISGGLVRADGKYLYPIRDGIPDLLIDEAIPLPIAQ